MAPRRVGSQPQGAEWQVHAYGQGMQVNRPWSLGWHAGMLPEAGDINETSGLCGSGGVGSDCQSQGEQSPPSSSVCFQYEQEPG